MKRTFSTLFCMLTLGVTYGQGFTISPSSTLNEDIDVGVYHMSNINLEHDNSTNDSLQIQWEVVHNTMPASWDYSYCDYTNCYTDPLTQTSGTMKKIGPGQVAFFKVTLLADVVGSGTLKVKVYKTGDSANADTLVYNYTSYLSLTDIELGKNVVIYPNPLTSGTIHINETLPNSTVEIINSLGQTCISKALSGVNNSIPANELNKGVYFVKLKRNNETYLTRKLIVK